MTKKQLESLKTQKSLKDIEVNLREAKVLLTQKEADVDAAQKRVAEINEKIQSVQKSIENNESEIQGLNKEIANKETQIAQIKTSIRSTTLAEELDKAKAKLESANKDYQVLEDKTKRLQREKNSLEAEIQGLKTEKEKIEQELSSIASVKLEYKESKDNNCENAENLPLSKEERNRTNLISIVANPDTKTFAQLLRSNPDLLEKKINRLRQLKAEGKINGRNGGIVVSLLRYSIETIEQRAAILNKYGLTLNSGNIKLKNEEEVKKWLQSQKKVNSGKPLTRWRSRSSGKSLPVPTISGMGLKTALRLK